MDLNTSCEQCGQPRRARQRFCSNCGCALDATRELKQATVLLADLCDCTSTVVASGTEEGHAFLERAYHVMSEAIGYHGGVQIQWRGDELLALFGAPRAQQDHAVRACLAALRLLRHMGGQTAGERAPMTVRIGLASGEVLIGPGIPALGARYSVDGSAIHLAGRLQRLAAPGTALISSSTRRLTEHCMQVNDLGERLVRGFDKPVRIHQLLADSHPGHEVRRRHFAPLLGRHAVMAELQSEAAASARGGLRLFGIRGDAGIGKSRVLDQLREVLRTSGTVCVSVRAGHRVGEIPYGLVADLLRVVVPLKPSPHAEEPAVVELMGEGDPGEAWRTLSPAQRRRRIFEDVVRLLTEITSRAPLVVLIDDVFLADADSLRLLESLSKPLASQPLLLVLSYRSEFVHRWGDAAWFHERELQPLDTLGMTALAQALLGNDPTVDALRQALLDRADGNPFFLEQLVLMLADRGSLEGYPGAYRVVAEAGQIGVPASVVATIASQVDGLGIEAKRTLEAAAVIEEPLDPALIAAMLGESAAGVAARLQTAEAGGLLEAPTHTRGHTASFRHALVRETIYNALPRQRRADLHQAAYEAIRSRRAGQVGDAAHLLARHAYLGGDWIAASTCALASMERATARSANRDALRTFERGLDAAGRISDDKVRQASELALRMAALGPMMAMGQMDGIVTNLERAEAISRQSGDTRRHAAVSLQLAVSLWTRGNYRQGLEAADNANQAARVCVSRSLQMAALQARMMLHHASGTYAQAAEDAALVHDAFAPELAARRLLPGWAVVAVVNLRAFQADLFANADRMPEAQAALDAAYAELTLDEHAFSRVLVDFVQAGVWMMSGHARDAAQLLHVARDLCRKQDVVTMLPPILARLAGALAEDGRVGEALQMIETAIEQKLQLVGGRYNDFYFPYYHACILLSAGRGVDAARAGLQALAAATGHGQHAHAALARLVLARVSLHNGEVADASLHLEQARCLAHRCHMSWLRRAADALAPEVAAHVH